MPTVPQNPAQKRPTVKAYGIEVFTDLSRRAKQFPVLFYRWDKPLPRAEAQAFADTVIDLVTAAGLLINGSVQVDLTPVIGANAPVTKDTQFRCHVKVGVLPASEKSLTDPAWVEGLRRDLCRG